MIGRIITEAALGDVTKATRFLSNQMSGVLAWGSKTGWLVCPGGVPSGHQTLPDELPLSEP
ncbi:MAG: hypothetical protein JNL98_26340 [Bryobacterales bacterium]|nr:hypothetical protein [Bryobacterales bacterium]